MSLGEYKSRGAADTRLLLHLNGNTSDSSGNGNNGTGTNITYVNSRLGKCASFSMSPNTWSHIQVPDHSSLNIRDAITVSVWYNLQNFFGNGCIVSKWSVDITPSARQYLLYCDPADGVLGFYIQTSSGEFSVFENESRQVGIWRYVTGVYDGTTVKLYVDGVLKNQLNATGQIDNPNPASDLGIGAVFNLTSISSIYSMRRFRGYMDEVIIEGRAWSYSEIKRYYTNTLGKFATI
jgi:hypothetical protein